MRLILMGLLLVSVLLLLGCTSPENTPKDNSSNWYDSVVSDARAKYPDADLVEVEGESAIGGHNITLVKVVFNSGTPCPVRMRLKYDRDFGFSTGVPTYIVKDCEYKCVGSCHITTEEEAIVAAHTLPGSEDISEFLLDYPDARAEARLDESKGLWIVDFTSEGGTLEVNLTSRSPKIVNYVLNQ